MKIKYLELSKKAHAIADSKKAKDPIILNVRRMTTVADYFVIATAESAPQINAIATGIYKEFRDTYGLLPGHREGIASSQWTVLDYGGLVVHVMSGPTRKLYNLEKIWAGARKLETAVKKPRKSRKK